MKTCKESYIKRETESDIMGFGRAKEGREEY